MPESTSLPSLQSQTFEELVTELEQVARSMDAPELGIEQAADLYERAGALHRAAAAVQDWPTEDLFARHGSIQ